MRAAVLLVTVLVLAAAASADTSERKTVIATWNPVGTAKGTLRLEPLGRGRCGPGSEVIGNFGYRCGAGRWLADPCWRDGPAPTDLVVCPTSPWSSRAATIRVRNLMFAAGVTFAAPIDFRRDAPWAVELADGSRCRLLQGAHDSIKTKHGRITVDYYCDGNRLFLLRNLTRGQVWRIGAATWSASRFRLRGSGYQLRGTVAIRRAIFPSLPPAMQSQNDLARAATRASGLRDLLMVRMGFPAHEWAYVQALAPENSKAITVWRLVHRRGTSWNVVRVRRPACQDSQVPKRVRRQLFGCRSS